MGRGAKVRVGVAREALLGRGWRVSVQKGWEVVVVDIIGVVDVDIGVEEENGRGSFWVSWGGWLTRRWTPAMVKALAMVPLPRWE